MENNIWIPHEGPQREYLSRLEDEVLFGGAKGPGKTDCLIADALGADETGKHFDIENPNYKAIILRRTYPQLQEIIDRSHQRFSRHAKWHGDLMRHVFPSGASITFGHCHNEDDKRRDWGQEFQFIGFDQLEEFSETQFKFICLSNRTSDPKIKCRIRGTANPGGMGHFWVKRYFIDGKEPGKTYEREWTLPDGRIVTKT